MTKPLKVEDGDPESRRAPTQYYDVDLIKSNMKYILKQPKFH